MENAKECEMQRLRYVLVLLVLLACVKIIFAQQSPVERSFRECESYNGPEESFLSNRGNSFVIQVLTQKDLEDLTSAIKNAIKKGQHCIEIVIAPGV